MKKEDKPTYSHNPLSGKVTIKNYEHIGAFSDNFSARRAYNRERELEAKRHAERQKMKD